MEEEKKKKKKMTKTTTTTTTTTTAIAGSSPLPSCASSLITLLACVGLIMGTGWYAVVASSALPTPLKLDAAPEAFSEERSLRLLNKIVDIGMRPVGSVAADVAAPAFFVRELEKLQAALADTQRAGHLDQDIALDIDVHKSDGSFLNELLEWEFASVYANTTNVVARLSPASWLSASPDREKGFLIVSHFDTSAGSLGAMDDGLPNAIMLEILRALVSDRQFLNALKAPLVLLWNGGEEPILTGAHAFLSHPWIKDVGGFVNLESSGWGGREMLYQASPHSGGLLEQFAESSPYPFGQSFAQDLFLSGLIPADTDYRIFRDKASLPGLDLAFYQHGYVYHTYRDDLEHVVDGAAQHMGDNILALVKLVGKEGIRKSPHQSTIWFDLWNRALFVIPKPVLTRINYSIVSIAATAIAIIPSTPSSSSSSSSSSLVAWMRAMGCCFRFVLVYAAGMLLSLGLPCLAAIVLVNCGVIPPLIWYSNVLLAYALYTPFCIIGLTLPTMLIGPVAHRKEVYLSSLKAIVMLNAALLLVLTLTGLDSSYILTLITVSASLQLFITQASSSSSGGGGGGASATSTASSFWSFRTLSIGSLLLGSVALALIPGPIFIGLVFAFWVPNTGKMGEAMIPGVDYATADVLTAVIFALLTVVTFHSLVLPTVELVKAKASAALAAFKVHAALIVALLGVAALAIGAARSMARPFTYDTPKRLILQKTTWLDAIPQQHSGPETSTTSASFSSRSIEQAWTVTGLELSRMDETLSELCDVFKASPLLSSGVDVDQGDCGARFYSPGSKALDHSSSLSSSSSSSWYGFSKRPHPHGMHSFHALLPLATQLSGYYIGAIPRNDSIPTPSAVIEPIRSSSPTMRPWIVAVSVDLPLGPAWSTLVVSSSELLGWSLSPKLPRPMQRRKGDVVPHYLSRLSGAQSIRFTLELASQSSSADLEFAFMYLPPFNDTATGQSFDAFIDRVPDWMTIIPTETFLMRMRIGR